MGLTLPLPCRTIAPRIYLKAHFLFIPKVIANPETGPAHGIDI